MASEETFEPAFTGPPGTILAGLPLANLRLPTPNISRGLLFQNACAKHVRETFQASRVYIVASKSLAAGTDDVDKLISALGEHRVAGVRREGISPHSPISEILEIAAECSEKTVDCVVTLGAGSITDGCKLVVFALANNITTTDQLLQCSYESKNVPTDLKEPTIPLITIPTTLSGGEYFSLAGGTDTRNNHKTGFLHSGMGSRLIILDPTLTLTTPAYHWLSTGVRALDHCVEALCSLQSSPESDAKAADGLKLLAPALLRCKNDPNDVEARAQCQLAVRYAMENIRAGIPMGGSHAIGHMLGPLGVPHGITSCVLLPAIMTFNARYGMRSPDAATISDKQTRVRKILWTSKPVATTMYLAHEDEEGAELGTMLDIYIRALGMPRTVREVLGRELGREEVEGLAERSLLDFWAGTNPVPLVRKEQVEEILGMVV